MEENIELELSWRQQVLGLPNECVFCGATAPENMVDNVYSFREAPSVPLPKKEYKFCCDNCFVSRQMKLCRVTGIAIEPEKTMYVNKAEIQLSGSLNLYSITGLKMRNVCEDQFNNDFTLITQEQINDREYYRTIQHRKFRQNSDYIDTEEGEFVTSTRSYAPELEFIAQEKYAFNKAWEKVVPEVGLSGDGSVSGTGDGIEIQFPVVAGKKGEEIVTNALSEIAKAKTHTNKTCGYHVHISTNEYENMEEEEQFNFVKNLWLLYYSSEKYISLMLPKQRRGNKYAKRMDNDGISDDTYEYKKIAEAGNMEELEQIWYKTSSLGDISNMKSTKYTSSRYHGVNLHCLFSSNGTHYEVRYHSGTLNYKKVLYWANLHVLMCDLVVKAPEKAKELAESLKNKRDLEKGLQLLLDGINAPKNLRNYINDRVEKFKLDENCECDIENDINSIKEI
jgi:hypothetical protein